MKTLDEIKKLMSDGETAQADEALKELLAANPENLQAKMLYGTCRQLLGDEETFKRIHDEIAPILGSTILNSLSSPEVRMWENYHREWESITGTTVEMGTRPVSLDDMLPIVCMYGCPPYRPLRICKKMIWCAFKLIGVLFLFWLAWWLGQKL
jgi:hypothetical protein